MCVNFCFFLTDICQEFAMTSVLYVLLTDICVYFIHIFVEILHGHVIVCFIQIFVESPLL